MITFEQFQHAKQVFAIDERSGKLLTFIPMSWEWQKESQGVMTTVTDTNEKAEVRSIDHYSPRYLFARRSDAIAEAIRQTKEYLKKLEGLLEKAIEAEGVEDALEAHEKGLL